jgi:hypothetical protein
MSALPLTAVELVLCSETTHPEHNRQAADLILERDALPNQFLARDDECPDRMGGKRLHMDRFVEPGAGKMCQPARVVAVSLVRRTIGRRSCARSLTRDKQFDPIYFGASPPTSCAGIFSGAP